MVVLKKGACGNYDAGLKAIKIAILSSKLEMVSQQCVELQSQTNTQQQWAGTATH